MHVRICRRDILPIISIWPTTIVASVIFSLMIFSRMWPMIGFPATLRRTFEECTCEAAAVAEPGHGNDCGMKDGLLNWA
jgi:hypothetical protein